MSRPRAGLGTKGLTLILVAIIAVAAGAAYYVFVLSSTPTQHITLGLSYPAGSGSAPYYYGLVQGYYSAEGINLTIVPGSSSLSSVSLVAAGKLDFAIADASGPILAAVNSNITNVRIIAVVFAHNYYAVAYNEATITTLSDLQGSSGAAPTPSTSTETPLFSLLVKENGLNLSKTSMQYGSTSVTQPLLLQGSVQFILSVVQQLPILNSLGAPEGKVFGAFPFYEYGVDAYGSTLITSTAMIQEHPDLVQRMVKATMMSETASKMNPSAAVSAEVKEQPQLNYTVLLPSFEVLASDCMLNVTSSTNPLQFGYVDPQRMQQTVSLTVEALGIAGQLNASSFYTDAFTSAPA